MEQRPPIAPMSGLSWLRSSRGATTTEYLVMLMAGIMVVVAAIQVFGGGLGGQYESATDVTTRVSGGEAGAASAVSTGSEGMGGGAQGEAEDESEVVHTGEVDREGRRIGSGPAGPDEDDSGTGINPLILILVIAGVLGLGYLMFSDDS